MNTYIHTYTLVTTNRADSYSSIRMEESLEVIPQQEVELVKRSEMCIGLNCVMMTLPKNTVTGITIMIA